jgi:hypothetical protein
MLRYTDRADWCACNVHATIEQLGSVTRDDDLASTNACRAASVGVCITR